MSELCSRQYTTDSNAYQNVECERPKGHREDSESVYADPDGCHHSGGLIWTNRWSKPEGSRDPYAECRCNHGRHTRVAYTGACGLCDCPAVRTLDSQPTGPGTSDG